MRDLGGIILGSCYRYDMFQVLSMASNTWENRHGLNNVANKVHKVRTIMMAIIWRSRFQRGWGDLPKVPNKEVAELGPDSISTSSTISPGKPQKHTELYVQKETSQITQVVQCPLAHQFHMWGNRGTILFISFHIKNRCEIIGSI